MSPLEVPSDADEVIKLPDAWTQRASTPASTANTKTEVLEALDFVRIAFTGSPVLSWPDGMGGAHVVISQVPLAPRWHQRSTWVAFHINHMCPESDTYPHYVREDLAYSDGRALQVPITVGAQFEDVAVVQVSRRTARHDPITATPANKTRSVVAWLRETA